MELEYYGGCGYGGVNNEGHFSVRFEGSLGSAEKHFKVLRIARLFYNALKCEKALWDLTIGAELLEAHIIKPTAPAPSAQ